MNFPGTKRKYRTRRETIYVDESGNSGMRAVEHNKKYPFFIIGFCYCREPTVMNRHLRKLLTKVHRRGIYPADLNELKFYPTPALRKLGYPEDKITSEWSPYYSSIRYSVLHIILNHSDGIFAGIQDKTALRNIWTSEKLGNRIFKESLLQHVLPNLSCSTDPSVIYDRGRLSPNRTKMFNQDMLGSGIQQSEDTNINGIRIFHDAESYATPGIWAADFVAGAFHFALMHDDPKYQVALKPKFIGDGYVKF